MIAFDTCVLVRFLVVDDLAQADAAEALMRDNTDFLVPKLRLGMPCWSSAPKGLGVQS